MFTFFNDTGRTVHIHPATFVYGCESDRSVIDPLTERIFTLPDGMYPYVKMWDYGKSGLHIMVLPMVLSQTDSNQKSV